MEKWEDTANRIFRLAKLATFPIGVKYFEKPEEFPAGVKKNPIRQTVCQITNNARILGRVLIATPENADRCYPGGYCFGFIDLPPEAASGERSTGTYDASPEIAKKAFSHLSRFEKGQFAGFLAAPLGRIPVDPDVICVYGNAAQIHQFVVGWVFMTGDTVTSSTIGRAPCSEVYIAPYLTGKPQMTLPGNGERVFCSTQDYEVTLGIPAEHIEMILVGIEAAQASGIRYPVTWNVLDSEPQSYAAYYGRPEPYPESLQKPGGAGLKVLEKYGLLDKYRKA